jgi:hypothetical protein
MHANVTFTDGLTLNFPHSLFVISSYAVMYVTRNTCRLFSCNQLPYTETRERVCLQLDRVQFLITLVIHFVFQGLGYFNDGLLTGSP